MKRLDKCECGCLDFEVKPDHEDYSKDTMTRKLVCVKCSKEYEEIWKLESVVAIPDKKYFLIGEQTTVSGDIFMDHVISKAVNEEDAIEKYKKHYGIKEVGDNGLPKFDNGEKAMEITDIKEITKEEFIVYGKVFNEV